MSSILNDIEITRLAKEKKMIIPFSEKQRKTFSLKGVETPCPSYGLSSCGYDITLQPKWLVAKDEPSDKPISIIKDYSLLDDEFPFIKQTGESVVIPPKGFILGVSNEYFKMPDDIMASLFAKSTLARKGLFVPPTITEPGWEGELVVEIKNELNRPIIFYSGIGAGQMIFFKLTDSSSIPYSGKYQGQTGVTPGFITGGHRQHLINLLS